MAWAFLLRVGHGQITVGPPALAVHHSWLPHEQEMGMAGVLSDTAASLGCLLLEATFSQLRDTSADAGKGYRNCR